jgi:tol-pal system protein YbgF
LGATLSFRRNLQRGAAVGAALLLAACAEFGPAVGGSQPSAREQRLQALEARLDEMARKVEDLALAPQGEALMRLEAEVRGLRGEVERLRYDFDAADKRSRELYQDLDGRLSRLEGAGATARLPAAPVAQEEEAAYTAVFEQLRARKYDEAIAGFRAQLARWPQGRYADNARYWLGEAHYAKKEYDPALESFRALLAQFPDSPKAADALFKVGVCQADKQQRTEARATWQKVIAQYPNSQAAGLARERLQPPK